MARELGDLGSSFSYSGNELWNQEKLLNCFWVLVLRCIKIRLENFSILQGGGPDGLFQLRWPASVADVSLRGDWTKIPSQYTWFRKVFLD